MNKSAQTKQPKAAQTLQRDPTSGERKGIEAAKAFCRERADPLSFKVEGSEGKIVSVSIPHDDHAGFEVQRRATFGTTSFDFATHMIARVGTLMREPGCAMPTESELNTSLAAVAGIAPRNEMEAMLAVQMVGTHGVAVEMLDRAKRASTPEKLERYGTLATKMLRTYTAQIEALAKLRRGGEQKVVVEHVHVYAGGQAVVGSVATGGRVGDALENGDQPHAHAVHPGHTLAGAAAVPLATGTTVLREDARRDGVPSASGARSEPVPDARRRTRQRCANR